MTDFVHLHVHTEYSLLDGAVRIKDLIKRVKELDMSAVAITDHGVMYGVVDFYKEAVENGIKPVIGCEVYIAPRSMQDKDVSVDSDRGHLILLCENNKGYKNLMKLVTLGFTHGYYYKPRVDLEALEKHSEGLIALSACLSGNIPLEIRQGNYERAKEIAYNYRRIFGENNFFLEIQSNDLKDQNLVNQNLIKMSRETGIPLVATNDVHYLMKEDAKAHDVLLCIQTGKRIKETDRMRFNTDQVYLKTSEEMLGSFSPVPEALENTCRIAQRCNVKMDFNKLHLPEYIVEDGTDNFTYLRKLCFEGLESRYKEKYDAFHRERLNYELSVIKNMGYVDYFLIVWDFIKYAKDNKIMVGPGRGSGAGSIVSYCLGITNIDPIKYNLLFERFLNPERISMPDLDIDFCYERRQEVIDYVIAKYGSDRVSQIITFGTMAARAVIRDVGRVMDIPYQKVDQIAKMIPFSIGMTIDKALETNPDLRDEYENDEIVKELITTSRILEGMPRHSSTHAAGVVISKEPVVEYVPLQKNDDVLTTQFTMGNLEELGLLKMDFLGLRTLTVLRYSAEAIEKNHGIKIDLDNMSMDDPDIFKMISEGKTTGVFQLESEGMTQFMKDLKPSSLEDIIAGISLYRPGPMDQIPRYVNCKNNPDNVTFDHPLLEDILDVTYGCMVYQEQVMQIVRNLAGYSLGRADIVRRAMSKKKIDVMEEERKNFVYGLCDKNGNCIVKGAMASGVPEDVANKLFDEMMDFASYAFNKSHAAAYAVIAYQTAWFKYYYPTEFMAALLNSYMGSQDKITRYITECKKQGIDVLPPDINESDTGFGVDDTNIRFGMAAVKNVGEHAVKDIINERKKGRYLNFKDFCERISDYQVNKKCVESLIKCGAFDSFGVFRSRLSAVSEKVIDNIHSQKRKQLEGQISLFDMVGAKETGFPDDVAYPQIPEFEKHLILTMEKEILGMYISGHPLDEFTELLELYSDTNTLDLKDIPDEISLGASSIRDGKDISIGGLVADIKTKTTKSDNIMGFVQLEDLYGQIEVLVFPKILYKYNDLLSKDNIVLIKGRVSFKEEEDVKIICEEVISINDLQNRGKDDSLKNLYIKITDESKIEEYNRLLSLFRFFRGNMKVVLYFESTGEKRVLDNNYCVNINDVLLDELNSMFGKTNVKIS